MSIYAKVDRKISAGYKPPYALFNSNANPDSVKKAVLFEEVANVITKYQNKELWEINCNSNEYRLLENENIKHFTASRWMEIPDETSVSTLSRMICGKKKQP